MTGLRPGGAEIGAVGPVKIVVEYECQVVFDGGRGGAIGIGAADDLAVAMPRDAGRAVRLDQPVAHYRIVFSIDRAWRASFLQLVAVHIPKDCPGELFFLCDLDGGVQTVVDTDRAAIAVFRITVFAEIDAAGGLSEDGGGGEMGGEIFNTLGQMLR